MDQNNNILPYGTKGEICIKGDAVMIEYLNKPEATAETIKDGWLHTGDLGYMDEEGYIFYSGRLKEMINRGGENIYTARSNCRWKAIRKSRKWPW